MQEKSAARQYFYYFSTRLGGRETIKKVKKGVNWYVDNLLNLNMHFTLAYQE